MKKGDDLESWAQSQGKREKNRAWMSWPPKAIEEVARVLEMNDAGRARVSARAMVGRLRDHHAIESATPNTLADYMRSLGRRGWANK